ncbi:hypothetical protein [Pedobacter agri]|uniref:hypothetical protein n=1 Tax=Pedobacter agri TaxID=454586 RepID=UPI00292F9BA2|nr:hypothetical protein [Pedobacter agri]
MARVITFSRHFPASHSKKGQPTHFVEKLSKGFPDYSADDFVALPIQPGKGLFDLIVLAIDIWKELQPKYHTIREGDRWKVGDMFSPRVWSGKPYASKQITIAPDIEIKKIWTFEVDENGVPSLNGHYISTKMERDIARNDGLSKEDFIDWLIMPSFKSGKPFRGQILCWNDKIEYL